MQRHGIDNSAIAVKEISAKRAIRNLQLQNFELLISIVAVNKLRIWGLNGGFPAVKYAFPYEMPDARQILTQYIESVISEMNISKVRHSSVAQLAEHSAVNRRVGLTP
jgi:hypothetical protein